MYVTRPLSMFQKNPSALSWPPPEGPNSGILVIEDEEAEQYTCFGLCKSDELKDLPFPQNKNLKLRYSSGVGENQHASYFYANLIPVLNQPLSSNRYYVIKRRGSHKGDRGGKNKPCDVGNEKEIDIERRLPPGVADCVCLGLIPTSEGSWVTAVKALRIFAWMKRICHSLSDANFWFIKVETLIQGILRNNEETYWVPDFVKVTLLTIN